MSSLRPKYKIKGYYNLTGKRTYYIVYVRKYWFIFPYWSPLTSELFTREDALMRLEYRMRDDNNMAAIFARIR
jgi:hypothetical protein